MPNKPKAVVLLSGGLDSSTLLYVARDQGFDTYALIFDYGQRHHKEIAIATHLADLTESPFHIVKIALPWQGSSLLDMSQALPSRQAIDPNEIPSTYVPARNIIFLSFAISYAETLHANAVFIGANAIDYSGYPDCRPEFFEAYEKVIQTGLKAGVEGIPLRIHAPFVNKTKADIIRTGLELQVPYDKTWSCYQGDPEPCGICESCRLRQKGFEEVDTPDPLIHI